ncbi:hypothetical protein [Kiritimatiella glycovorans]|uniref:Uncharacterized protein n=1 Tax=Kiritimatiella glycovorans TaxID=1307763 RepID=A0A0G3EG44_9BACT|nr:hypothetical protein [Kiritimatiella glycovorans]AKJ65421.1 hypothetical protein L21SP4_02194 [Kiritimatiella glycovorans]
MKKAITIAVLAVSSCAFAMANSNNTMVRINQKVQRHKTRLPPLSYRAFKILTMPGEQLKIADRVVSDEVTAGMLGFRPGEKVIGCNSFRTGAVLYSNYAIYFIGENNFREHRGLDPAPKATMESREAYAFRTKFYCVMPLSYIPETRFREVQTPYGEEGDLSWEMQLPDGQKIILPSRTIKVFAEMVADIIENHDYYERYVEEEENNP